MKEFQEVAHWLGQHRALHAVPLVESLPAPAFRMEGHDHVSFSSNNYLGLAAHPRMIASARKGLERYGVGNCESRLLGGDLEIYGQLERKLADLKGKDSALIFATGYLTNLGVLGSLVKTAQVARMYGYRRAGRHDYAYFSDEYNHVSIREGIRLSGADRLTYRHLDLDHLDTLLTGSQAMTKIIVTDGVFSQDGDIAPLPELLAISERHDAMLYVDDAHGTGVLGKTGGGITEHFGINSERLICMGTLSKAYGAIGGFIATDSYIGDILRLTCPAYGFTSTLPPDQVLAVSEAIDIVREEPGLHLSLWENQRYFVEQMSHLAYTLIATSTPIVPILIGDEALTDHFSDLLRAAHLHVDSVKFPAVPRNQGRLRVILNAGHTREQIDRLVSELAAHQGLLISAAA
ncbi:pyridoxal phosphate-dependent aminotransferase family protein [Rhodocyclus tenuis]|uniref:Pyridoxal phosphate-dependent aminotransferase family protein n=1 Tax=Rhodocyclus gracilis TaxID=2929842 RepID=A0ABX0WKF3_9RHOO|nr:pyridoxal phosphate-dependent aminotransferase family protein [Rhodocyclus gracilis]NJA90084.1 pyridoxal phosphate-dependent aminotransferase family protein [Rhodocyclus gracilis]